MKKNYNKRTEKDYGFWRVLWYRVFLKCIVTSVMKCLYNVKVEGRENVPETSRVIYVPNHVSFLDPPLTTYATNKNIAYMAKKELFEGDNELLKFLVHSLGSFAVNREKPEVSTFKSVKVIFNTSWSLGIFPQGGIVEEHVIEHVTKGFVLFARKYKADIIPVGICGFDGYAHKLFEKHLTVKIGKPISCELGEDEILKEWANQICEMTGFENKLNLS